MRHPSARLRRAPAFVVVPVLALGLIGAPGLDTSPEPGPVEPELATVELDGVDSVEAAVEEMPEAVHDEPAHDEATHEDAGHDETEPDPGHDADFEVAATSEPTDTDPYRVVAVTWDDADVEVDELNAWIRYRSEGEWSDWYPLPGSDDHAPDPGSSEAAQQRDATEPLVVPESDGVQVRVDTEDGVDVDDLRVDLIDPGVSPADASAGTIDPGAAQAANRPTIYTRADWGADESLRGRTVEYGQIQAGFVHHTVNSNAYSAADVPAIIRGIYAFHVKSRGWRDIGYNFLIDKWGRIWEGRYGGVDKPVIGAHTYGHNDDAFAASTIGTYTSTEPTAATLDAYARLFAWKFDMHGVDPLSTVNLDGTRTAAVSGHRDTYATACPGDRLYAKLPQIRTATARYMTGTTSPSGTLTVADLPATLRQGDSVTLSARTTNVPAGTAVRVERRFTGQSTWYTVRNDTLSSTGTAEFSIKPNSLRSFDFRVVVATSPALTSPAQTVRVVAATTTAPPPTTSASYIPASSDVFSRPSTGRFSLTGHGWGHGRGMSQWGARQAASSGAAEPTITSFYYPGTTRSSTAPNSSIDVLLTADTGSDVIVRAEPGLAVSYRAQSGQQTSLTLPSRIGSCTVGWWRAQATQSDIAIQALCGGSYTTWRSRSQVSASAPVVFTPSDGMADVARRLSSSFERKAYRGSIEAHLVGSSLRAVNSVPLEEYLRGVVPNEMPSSWPQEALRAQAVAARTYAMREAQDRGGYFDVYDTTASQVYPGARLYDSSWRVVRSYEATTTDAAISATRGVYLRHDGRPAFTQFSSSNGGVTAAGTQPYLRRQADPWDRAATSNSRLNWTDSVSAASLEGKYPQIGRLERIRVLDREGLGDWGGRVLTMRLEGTRGSVTISGDSRVRSALGTNSSYLTLR